MQTQTAERGRTRDPRDVGASDASLRAVLAGSQIRTCVGCGRHTTFVVADRAGGWYACTWCGRYA
jgi:hypothetical protein